MKTDRSSMGACATHIRTRPALRLVPETLETLLTRVIAEQRADTSDQADFLHACHRDAIAAIRIGRATGLLTPRTPDLVACT